MEKEREGEKDMRSETKKETGMWGYRSERRVKRWQQLFSLKNQKRERDFIADRARERES